MIAAWVEPDLVACIGEIQLAWVDTAGTAGTADSPEQGSGLDTDRRIACLLACFLVVACNLEHECAWHLDLAACAAYFPWAWEVLVANACWLEELDDSCEQECVMHLCVPWLKAESMLACCCYRNGAVVPE